MPEEILGIEISSQEIRYVDLKKKQKDLFVEKSGRVNLPAFSLSSPGDLSRAIQDIIAKEKITPTRIYVTLSSDDLFIQQAVFPKMSEGELKSIIRAEIERIPKFAGKEFDFVQAQYLTEDRRFMVIFSALAQENRDYYLEAVRRTKIANESLEICPLNLLELFYSRLVKNSVEGLIVLGDVNSRIMIYSQNECKLFFQMAVGKRNLYATEKEIKNSIFLSWTEEIRRVLKSYQRQYSEYPLERIWLVWDNQNCQDLAEMLGKSLEVEISAPRFEEFGVKIKDSEINPIYFLPLTGPLIHLKTIKQKFDFSIFLRNVKLKDAIKSTGRFVLIYSAVTLIVAVVLITWLTVTKGVILKKSNQAAERTVMLEKETALLNREKSQLASMRNLLLAQASFVSSLNKTPWSNIFSQLIQALPSNVVVSNFELSDSLEIKLDCSTFNISSIAEFIRNINKNPSFMNTQFDFLREKEAEGMRTVDFSLNTKFKKDGS